MGRELRVVEIDRFVVIPQVRRVVVVGHGLAVVAEPAVEALLERVARAANGPESPLAETAECVTLRLEQEWQPQRPFGDRLLAFWKPLRRLIVADVTVPRVLSGHQGTARGGAHVVSRAVRNEPHSLPGQAIDIRGADLLLAIAADVAVSEIIRDDEHDVRPVRRLGRPGGGDPCDRKKPSSDGEETKRHILSFRSLRRPSRAPFCSDHPPLLSASSRTPRIPRRDGGRQCRPANPSTSTASGIPGVATMSRTESCGS